MKSFDFLESASKISFAKLDKAGGNIQLMKDPLQTIAIVYSAQGIIDNGGLEYFFSSDFPENPPYQMFIDAYNKIGAFEEAEGIKKSLAFFEDPNPELNLESRLKFIDSLPSDFSHQFSKISEQMLGSESVWFLLNQYAELNQNLIDSSNI
ncbi:DMP19 family protein [Solimicrobium silvestre]|uniref:DNA mimic protein DMP19 C-terminal domain-containing protein n=1 Tax=Solimicrobium silvestre TaxID=2099400 RepID=A0A2S9GT51_9BURK|nr:DUF4375 domain-containing protein [Solimicrobium silvestre]PRC90885.1 hypothetical protein S2091_4378 [Solimicrobium silvestre]